MIRKALSHLKCYFCGHFYHPMHFQCGSRVQYQCQCCGELTPWMHKREHHAFLLQFCPTWGDRGDDSQGYKKMGKLHKPPFERTIGQPEGGWTPGTYLVRIARKKGDIYNAILHVPTLSSSGGVCYETVWCPLLEREYKVRDLHYLEIVQRSDELTEFL